MKNKKEVDKCSNCGSVESKTFWDYDDGSVLCDKCHNKIGNEWVNNSKVKEKSNSWVYIIVILLAFATLYNFSLTVQALEYYTGAVAIDGSVLELEDGTTMLKSDYLSYSLTGFVLLLILFLAGLVTVFLIITKNILGVYAYAISVTLAIISQVFVGNYNVFLGLIIGVYIYKYLIDHSYFIKNLKKSSLSGFTAEGNKGVSKVVLLIIGVPVGIVVFLIVVGLVLQLMSPVSYSSEGEIDSQTDLDSASIVNTETLTNEPTLVEVNPVAEVDYFLEFNKITVRVTGEHFDKGLLEQVAVFGDPAIVDKVLVNNIAVDFDLNQVYSNVSYLSNLNSFVDSEILVEYSYDPDSLGGNYCIGDSCIIRLFNSYILPIQFTYNVDSNALNIFDYSLEENQAEPVFIITPEETYESNGFILLKSQEKALNSSEIKLSKFSDLVNKTNSFLAKPNKKATIFLVPDGMLQAFYFNDSSILLLPLYTSNQANATFVHEYSHFLLNESYFPMWIQEGIAEYVSKKVTYSSCGSWIDKGTNLLDWGVIEIPQEKIPDLYGYACSRFMYFDSKFGMDKTKELIKELESIVENDVYSEEYSIKVENTFEKVSGEKITIAEFIANSY